METRNPFRGIHSARLGIDSTASSKVYKFGLWKKGKRGEVLSLINKFVIFRKVRALACRGF
jgi:hypothetical protein